MLEANSPDVVIDRFTDKGLENPVEMERREKGDTGERLQRHRAVDVLLDIDQDPVETFLVIYGGIFFNCHFVIPLIILLYHNLQKL